MTRVTGETFLFDRRAFLSRTCSSAVALGIVGAGLSCGTSKPTAPTAGAYAAGNVANLQAGSFLVVDIDSLFVGRDASGVYAMSSICTHAGCGLDAPAADGTSYCSCHGSKFDANGNVLAGPARTALQHYAVNIDSSGVITVHTDQPVASSVRTPA